MTRRRLVALFLLPLAFAALPLAAMAVGAVSGDSTTDSARLELIVPNERTNQDVGMAPLGFTADDHLAADCSGPIHGISALNGS
jgi:hypothetical protein